MVGLMTLMYSKVLKIGKFSLPILSLTRNKTFGVWLVKYFMQDIQTVYCFGY
jgi:hypothetical protein